jgi:hypothetical protein
MVTGTTSNDTSIAGGSEIVTVYQLGYFKQRVDLKG